MSIPDDPFSTTNNTTVPALRIQTEQTSPVSVRTDLEASNTSPRNGTQTPGSLLHPNGTSGTKTPRRVQWTSDSHIVQLHPIPAVPGSPVSQLDESNIDQVNAALERHRSRTYPSRPRPASVISSNGATDEDYDYRLDVDPPLAQVNSNTSESEQQPRSLQAILDTGVQDQVPSFIQAGETDGLPNITRQETNDDLSAAKDLVRAHTGKWGILRRRVKGAGAVNRAFTKPSAKPDGDEEKNAANAQEASARRFAEEEEEDDHHHHHQHGMHMPMTGLPGGASVLSSLLALYGQQNGMVSGTTSAASSRPSSEDDMLDLAERKRMMQGDGPWRTGSGNDTSASDTPAHLDSRRGSVTADGTRRPSIPVEHPIVMPNTGTTGSAKPPRSPGFLGFMKKAHSQIQDADRPKAARSGAGVFGALIQNTQNISGAATPAASTLAPAAHRPGYQLSRYSLPDANTPDQPPNWRPVSRTGSRPSSRAGSFHSGTAIDDSPSATLKDDFSMKKNMSSDDVLSMGKKRNKSGLSINLLKDGGQVLKEGGQAFKNAEKWIMSKTPLTTPPIESKFGDGYFTPGRPMTEDEKRRREWEKEKRRRKKAKEARKKQEIFIIQHVAAILARQQFILKLARALMMFGSPSHRLEMQIQATAKVLEIDAQVVYLPGTMLISFNDPSTHTSETKFLKQATGLDLGKLLATHHLYWHVVHDKLSVEAASKELDVLMTTPVYYNFWQTIIIAAACSAFICVIGFNGSFVDALMSMPLGVLLVIIQMMAARNDMFSNVFEIVVATIISFIAAALSSTNYFCYTALVSGGVVLILPGYIVLCGALELASRNITAGAVRIGYSVIYSLFLGFGISIGAELYVKITGQAVTGGNDYQCGYTQWGKPWWGARPSAWWYFLCAPGFACFISLRNQQPIFAKELPVMIFIACAGWAANHFSAEAFPNRSDLTSAVGSFTVGVTAHLWGRISNGSSFPVSVPAILFQLPSGLSNGGIFNFVYDSSSSGSTTAYSSGFQVAQQLVSVAIGLTVGLFVSAVVTHPFGGSRRTGSGIFSF